MSKSYAHNRSHIDYAAPIVKKADYTRSYTDGEDYEHFPKHQRMRHDGSWRYKHGTFPYHQIKVWARKFNNRPFNEFHRFVCSKFHKDSFEGLKVRKMAQEDNLLPWGYELDSNNIIRLRYRLNKRHVVEEIASLD
jgi:hypothetical protein